MRLRVVFEERPPSEPPESSPIRCAAIITNPTRGSHEAYAVTQKNVYHMLDSSAPGAQWVRITSNLFAISQPEFGNPALVDARLRNLTSIVADWRYIIPDDPANPAGPSHPNSQRRSAASEFRRCFPRTESRVYESAGRRVGRAPCTSG